MDDLELRKNVATNGRWFCALMVVIALHTGSPVIALLFAAVVGLSCVVDQLYGDVARYGSAALYLLAVILSLILLISIW